MEVNIDIDNVMSQITDNLPQDVQYTLKNELSYVVTGATFSEYSKQGMWDGTKNLYIPKTQVFPTGLLSRCIKVLSQCGYSIKFNDKRVKPSSFPIPMLGVKLRDYQEDCVNEMIKKTRGLIQVATSGGKTVIISSLIANLGVNTLVIVPTKELLKQTATEISKFLGIKVGIIGDGTKELGKVTVATFQSLTTSEEFKKSKFDVNKGRWVSVKDKRVTIRKDLTNYLNSVECLITDETQHLLSSSIQKIYNACENAYYRYGCSATIYHDKDEDVLIEASTGRVLRAYNASYLIKNKWISKPTIHLIPFKQDRLLSGTSYATAYSDRVVNNEKRNNLIRHIAEMEADNNHSVLISVRQINHGSIIYDSLKCKYGDKVVFLNSSVSSEQVSKTLERLSKKEILIVIGTSMLNEGINIPSLDSLIFASSPKSNIVTLQLVGRVLRKTATKDTVDVYDIQDYGCKYLTSASKERFDIYCTESEFLLKEDNSFENIIDN